MVRWVQKSAEGYQLESMTMRPFGPDGKWCSCAKLDNAISSWTPEEDHKYVSVVDEGCHQTLAGWRWSAVPGSGAAFRRTPCST